MTDWLEEIEGRLNRRAIGGVHIVGGIVRPWDDDAAWLQAKEYTRSDMTRLIAHVRELKAQTALDAAVVEAMRGLPLSHLFALVAAQDYRWDEAEEALLNAEAALAALEGR